MLILCLRFWLKKKKKKRDHESGPTDWDQVLSMAEIQSCKKNLNIFSTTLSQTIFSLNGPRLYNTLLLLPSAYLPPSPTHSSYHIQHRDSTTLSPSLTHSTATTPIRSSLLCHSAVSLSRFQVIFLSIFTWFNDLIINICWNFRLNFFCS